MLDEVLFADAVDLDVSEELPDHVQLVVPGPYLAVVGLLGIVLQDVRESAGCEDLLPKVRGLDPIGIDGVASATVVLAFVEGQEVGGLTLQLCAELHLLVVDGEVDGAPAQPE